MYEKKSEIYKICIKDEWESVRNYGMYEKVCAIEIIAWMKSV